MEKRLERDEANKMIAGVCAGVAEFVNVDVTWVRVLFLVGIIFGFTGVWIYLILWIAIPTKPFGSTFQGYTADYKVYEQKQEPYQQSSYTPPATPPFAPVRKESNSGRIAAGVILLMLGIFFLLREFHIIPVWISIAKLWPLALIAIGVLILSKSGKKEKFTHTVNSNPADNFNNTNTTEKPGDQPLA